MYITLVDAKLYLNISTGTTGDDTTISALITASQQQIEQYCKRVFEQSTSSRFYRADDIVTIPVGSQWRPMGRGNSGYSWDNYSGSYGSGTGGYGAVSEAPVYGHRALLLGADCLGVDVLINGDSTGTVISSTGYRLYPRNEPPYDHIELLPSEQWILDPTQGEIEVQGRWGYSSAPPADIVLATKILTAYHYRSRDSSVFDVTATPELGIITVPKGFPSQVKKILDDGAYVKRIRFA